MMCVVLVVLTTLLCFQPAFGQGTIADYERSDDLAGLLFDGVTHNRVNPHWTADGNAFWYQSTGTAGDYQYIWVDAAAGTRRIAFDHVQVGLALQNALRCNRVDPNCLPLTAIEKDTPDSLIMDADNRRWSFDRKTSTLDQLPGRGAESPIERLTEIQQSGLSGEQVKITFVNRTAKTLIVKFIGHDGAPMWIGLLQPGERQPMAGVIGEVWLITDPTGKTQAIFKIDGDGGDAVIEPHAPPTTRSTTAPTTQASSIIDGTKSPDGKWSAFVKDYNIHIRDLKAGHEFTLTRDGTQELEYGDVLWSPDSTKLVALRTWYPDTGIAYLVQTSPPDQLAPKVDSAWYPRPGDPISITKPHLFDVPARKEIPIKGNLNPMPLDADFSNYSWDLDSKRFLFVYYARGSQLQRVIGVDADSGKSSLVFEERSKTFLDGTDKGFNAFLAKTHEIIWMSERDGWNQLYLYDDKTGAVKNQITRGPWVVLSVDRVDQKKRQIRFESGGIVRTQNPYYVHYCRVNFDGSGLIDLTPENGTHQVQYSPDRRFYIDTFSRLDLPPVNELRRSNDGSLVCQLERADMGALLQAGWKVPKQFVAKGRDGKTDIYGVIYRPSNFDPNKRYPVVEYIYPGPYFSKVPKEFTVYADAMKMAELGFIVVQIDAMGTSGRSKAFQDVCWHNLGDCGFPDRIRWIKTAAAKYPQMDLSRVGIYGDSEGGYAAVRALEVCNNFYKVAVCDSGPQDFRLYDAKWSEDWMGWPVGPWYAAQSNTANAANLSGKLFLIVCGMDHNVDPASSMELVNALINADKDFDLLVIPNAGHCDIGDYGERREEDFLVRNLLHVEPRSH
jgi:dipeptidyl-peptidase 4